MSLQRCQQETSSTEFLDWREYCEQDINAFHREDHFLANIATEVRRSFVKEPDKVRRKPFLLKFTRRKAVVKRPLTKKEATAKAKRSWFLRLGIKRKKK